MRKTLIINFLDKEMLKMKTRAIVETETEKSKKVNKTNKVSKKKSWEELIAELSKILNENIEKEFQSLQ